MLHNGVCLGHYTIMEHQLEITTEEIRAIRRQLGLSQVEAGQLIGGGPRAFTKYEAGTVRPATSVIHCVQLFYNLSDPGMEDMLYEVESARRFVGLRLSDPLPDETTILNFRHLLEEHELGRSLFEEVNRHLESQGLRLREGTIVDASIIEAPSSTKNRSGERDPEMRQTKKGNEWHFGMKVHIGADAETGVVHSVTTTPANVHDVTEAHRLLHGGEKRVWGDAGYQGVDKRAENRELEVEWQVTMRPGRRRQLDPGSYEALLERRKTSIRAKVEHPFLYVKRHFGYAKVRYRGLAKNTQRLVLLLGLTNLITAEGYLAA